jgi:tetratricopeptide (TPR) repeat protein
MRRLLKRFLGEDLLVRLAIFATLATYLQTVNFAYIYDDFPAIVMNPWLSSWRGLVQIFAHHSWGFIDGGSISARHYRPVFLLWLWMIQHVFSPSPGWYHLCSVLVHLVAIVLAHRLAKILLQDELGAAIATVLFAAHPTKVEAVSWISAASDPLMAVFFFGTILTYIRARESVSHRSPWFVASFLCALAALFTKESAVVLPGVIFAYECFFRKSSQGKRSFSSLVLLVFPYLAADFLWFFIRSLMVRGFTDSAIPSSIKVTLLTSPIAFWLYIRQLAWPVNLSALYPDVSVDHFSLIHTVLPVVAFLAMAAIYYRYAQSVAVLKFAATWFLLTLVPTIAGFTWIQLHDRHLYLPSFGVALMAAVAIRKLKWPAFENCEQLQVAFVLVIALVLVVISAIETRAWCSELTVFSRAVRIAPDNTEGISMLARAQFDAGNPELAFQTLQQALQRQPNSERLTFLLARKYYERGDYPHARPLLEKLARSPIVPEDRSEAFFELSMIELRDGHNVSAESLLRAAIQVAPKNAGYRHVLDHLQQAR